MQNTSEATVTQNVKHLPNTVTDGYHLDQRTSDKNSNTPTAIRWIVKTWTTTISYNAKLSKREKKQD